MFIQRVLRGIAALLLVIAIAGGAGIRLRARSEPPRPRAERPVAATAAADDSRYRVSFKDGATVEVIAVSTVPTGPHTWWKPDGTPLAEAPVDTIQSHTDRRHRGKSLVVLVRSAGIKKDDLFRWHPTRTDYYWGGRPRRNGESVPELDYYEAVFRSEVTDGEVQVRVAAGSWATEVAHDGGGGFGTFVNGHKFCFGKARAYQAYGRSLTTITVAHNFLGKDRRMVAVDREGRIHPPLVSASGSDGDPRHVVDLIDVEFELSPEQIKEYQVQFRPYEEVEIKGIALKPRAGGS